VRKRSALLEGSGAAILKRKIAIYIYLDIFMEKIRNKAKKRGLRK